MRKLRTKFLTEKEMMSLFVQMVKGLKQIHKAGLAHRRIDSKFVFLSGDYDNYIIKIGGCGEAFNIIKPIV